MEGGGREVDCRPSIPAAAAVARLHMDLGSTPTALPRTTAPACRANMVPLCSRARSGSLSYMRQGLATDKYGRGPGRGWKVCSSCGESLACGLAQLYCCAQHAPCAFRITGGAPLPACWVAARLHLGWHCGANQVRQLLFGALCRMGAHGRGERVGRSSQNHRGWAGSTFCYILTRTAAPLTPGAPRYSRRFHIVVWQAGRHRTRDTGHGT